MCFSVCWLLPSLLTSFAFNMLNFYQSEYFCVKFLQKKSPHFLCGDNRKVAKRYFYALVLGAIVSTRLLKSGNEFGVADELSKSRELIASFINMQKTLQTKKNTSKQNCLHSFFNNIFYTSLCLFILFSSVYTSLYFLQKI